MLFVPRLCDRQHYLDQSDDRRTREKPYEHIW